VVSISFVVTSGSNKFPFEEKINFLKVIEFVEVTKNLVCEHYQDYISGHWIKRLCNKQLSLIVVLWASCTSLERTNENQVSICICGPITSMPSIISFEDGTF